MQDSATNYHQQPQEVVGSKNYEVVAELGHGAQGSVYQVKEERTQQTFAAKVVSPRVTSTKIQPILNQKGLILNPTFANILP